METRILIGLLAIGIVFISGCVQEEELTGGRPGNDEKKDCPYECCVDGASYKIRACSDGYKCKENKCFEAGEENPPEEKEAPYRPEADSSVSWESLSGPPGGSVKHGGVIQNLSPPHELYALSLRGIHKSEDKGESWQAISGSQDLDLAINIHSIAAYRDKIFVCGDGGVYYYGSGKDPVKILDNQCNAITVSDNKLFVTSDSEKIGDVKITYAKLESGNFDWMGISPSETELKGLVLPPNAKRVGARSIIALGNRILAGVFEVIDEGKNLANGNLCISEDLGETWSRVELGMPDGLTIASIAQDPGNPEHLVLPFGYNTKEDRFPVSELLRESYDGGKTWSKVTGGKKADLTLESSGVRNVAISDSTYYLFTPYEESIITLEGSDYERFMPSLVLGSEKIVVGLETALVDFDNPSIFYASKGGTGIMRSEDGMKTWKKIDTGIAASAHTNVLTHPTDPKTVYTSGNMSNSPYLTHDFGDRWLPLFRQVFGEHDSGAVFFSDELKIDPHDPNHLIFITENTALFESFDAGETWSTIAKTFSSAKIFDFEIAKDGSGKIYASNVGLGISELDPLGDGSWKYLPNSSDYAYDIELDPEDNSVIYATYSPKVFENHSSIWRYSKNQKENNGWTELFKFEDSAGITSLRFDAQNPNRLYAGVIGKAGTIYVSDDKGKTWNKLNDELTFTTIMRHSQLQVDPSNKNIIYAGTWGGGTYKSVDGGKNWVKLENAPESPTCLAIYEKNPDIIYACDRVKPVIHKSEDGGQTWQEYYEFDRQQVLTSAVAIDPNDPDTIYAATFGLPFCVAAGLVVKITNGEMVANLSETLPGMSEGIAESAVEIEVDPNNPGTIYVSKHGYGVFKSVDGGETWKRLDDMGTGLPRLGYYDIDVDYSNSNNLYAAGLCELLPEYIIGPTGLPKNIEQDACGAYKSTDGGKSWIRMLETEHATMAVEVDPQNPNLLYVASSTQGLFVSSDGGESWKQETEGLPSFGIAGVIAKDGYVYASAGGSGVYAGTINNDYSITWDKSRSNKPKAYVSRIQVEIDPKNSNRIYATAYPGGMFRSDDAGKTWYERNTSQPSIIVDDPVTQGYYPFTIDPNNPADVWMGAYGKGMYRSHEYMNVSMFANGNNNELLRKDITAVVISPQDSKTVYAGTQQGVFVTRDDGESWEEMNDGFDTLDIRSLKITSTTELYAGTAGYGIYKFNPTIKKWQNLGRPWSIEFWSPWERRMYQFSSILFDPDVPGKVYYGHFPGGFFISEDNGHTWKDSSLKLGNDGIFSLSMHPDNHDILFAGTYNGVVKSADRGKTWEMISNGIPSEQWPYTVAIDDQNPNIMYTSTKNGQNKGFCERNEFCGVVMKTTDGGQNWFKIMNGLDEFRSEFYSLLIYPPNHNILFLSSNNGVYISRDSGNSWKSINTGLPTPRNQVRDNVAENLALTADNKYLILVLNNYGAWKADLSNAGLGS